MQAIDFFCGAGGLTKGLQVAGIEVIAGVDLNEGCEITYSTNNKPSIFIPSDIREITTERLLDIMPRLREHPDDILFTGCAPCQPFSQHRKTESRSAQATILREFGRLVEQFLPGQVLVENVSGIAKIPGYSTFQRFLNLLERNNYNYQFDVLNAKNYGIPQTRRRLVLIAMRNAQVSLPIPTHGKGLHPFATVRMAIEDFPELRAGETHPTIPNHVAAGIIPLNMERLQNTPMNGGDRRSWPERLVLDCHKSHKGHTDVYGRMFWDKPAPTLTGKCNSISNGRYGHPVQNRALSLREAAAIQTFPDDYVFSGTTSHVALQIGNAVPVKLGETLGRHILALRNHH